MSQNIIFFVPDMHCDSCPKVIKLSLEEIPGVQSAEASLSTKKVTVVFYPTQVTSETLFQVIKDTGYSPEIIKL